MRVGLKAFPNLRHLRLDVPPTGRRNAGWFASPDGYRDGEVLTLYIGRCTQTDLEVLAKLKAFKGLQSLTISGDYTDLTPLSLLSELRVLELGQQRGKSYAIDLASMPKLEYLRVEHYELNFFCVEASF